MKTERILTYFHPRPGIIKCAVLLKVLRATDYEYAVRFSKFIMVDPIWLDKNTPPPALKAHAINLAYSSLKRGCFSL